MISLRYVRLIAFVVGAAALGAEISAARLLAPYFGASTIIWANTIATVLVALSVGYWLGGKIADRRSDLRGLCVIVLVAGALLALVPLAANPFLRLSVKALGSISVGGFLGSLVGVLVLVAVPVLLLGTVAPYANRLSVQRVSDTGTVTGQLYAISTAGSLLGTFAVGAAADPADRDASHVPRVRVLARAGGAPGVGAARVRARPARDRGAGGDPAVGRRVRRPRRAGHLRD